MDDESVANLTVRLLLIGCGPEKHSSNQFQETALGISIPPTNLHLQASTSVNDEFIELLSIFTIIIITRKQCVAQQEPASRISPKRSDETCAGQQETYKVCLSEPAHL